MKKMLVLLMLLSTAACAPFKWTDPKAARCNELNRKIIFKTDRSSTRSRNIAEASAPRVQEEYDKECSNTQ